MTRDAVAVGIDIGGTKLVAGAVAADGTILDRRRTTTPAPRGDTSPDAPERLVSTIAGLAEALGPGLPVGVGVAGIIAAGRLEYSPNLAVEHLPLQQELESRLAVEVVVANDATVAGWGEVTAGGAKGVDDLVMFTLGTGVGGALVLRGRPVFGTHGFAGELGHLIVAEGGRLCPCGNRGCVEAYSSGTAMGAMATERLAATDDDSVLRQHPVVDGRAVTEAARAGDQFAIEVLGEAGFWLGVAVASTVNAFDPGLVLVGGGAAPGAAEWVLPAAAASMADRVMGRGHRDLPAVALAALGDDAGMIGAALLAVSTERSV
jgi:glucokinase